MSHRPERMSGVVREVVSDAIARKLSDPRISRFTSVTRVEISPDLQIAHCFLSIMGSESDGHRTMRGLESARGMLQSMLAKRLSVRQCPELRLHLDFGVKIAIETYRRINESLGQSDCSEPTDPQRPGEKEAPQSDKPDRSHEGVPE